MSIDVAFLHPLTASADGILESPVVDRAQELEKNLRRQVADAAPRDLMTEIAVHHSIPVMDREVQRFLRDIPHGGVIVDVGGGWGWHWRHIDKMRPDVTVVLVDFVKENLAQSRQILGDLVGRQVLLVCADAKHLPFADASVDGYWSVQTLQHIEQFEDAVKEAHRVLKNGGVFASYCLNHQMFVKWLYRSLGRPYHVAGMVEGKYYLERTSKRHENILARVFQQKIRSRFSEVIFKPELNCHGSGRSGSLLGACDAYLSSGFWPFKLLARQHSLHARKESI